MIDSISDSMICMVLLKVVPFSLTGPDAVKILSVGFIYGNFDIFLHIFDNGLARDETDLLELTEVTAKQADCSIGVVCVLHPLLGN